MDAIAVAVENREGISSVLRKARAKGIKVVTWDADADPDARDLFVNQATPRGIGEALMDNAARILGGKGEFAIITASLTAANMIAWQKEIEIRRASKYPDIKLAALRPCDDLQKKAFDEANTLLVVQPQHQADHGHLHARRPRRRRGDQAVRPEGRQGGRPRPAQRQQAVRPRGDHRQP